MRAGGAGERKWPRGVPATQLARSSIARNGGRRVARAYLRGDYLRDAVGHGFRRDALDVGERIGELLRGRVEHRALRHRRRGDPADVLHARLERALKIGVVESVFVDEFGGRTDGPLGSTPRRGLRGHRASVRGHHTRTPRSSFCPLPFFLTARFVETRKGGRTERGRAEARRPARTTTDDGAPRGCPPASVLGVAVTLTLASLVVDATDARAREPRDPAEKPGACRRAGTEAPRTPRGWCQRRGCDGFDADEVGGVDRARKLDECACVYAQAVCGDAARPRVFGSRRALRVQGRGYGRGGRDSHRSCEFPAFRASARR